MSSGEGTAFTAKCRGGYYPPVIFVTPVIYEKNIVL